MPGSWAKYFTGFMQVLGELDKLLGGGVLKSLEHLVILREQASFLWCENCE